ncbi:hypothetical protein [Nonomuraea sp. NPDC049400]|uniref:hypothetical protein n=1 Tax=Nonomuraea sp. NPDC049400 TaxID=3364352 RepID=UPI00379FFBD0
MADGDMPQIVQECHAYLREHGNLEAWLTDDATFEEVYTWASVKDPGLLVELKRRPEVVSWIQGRAEAMWTRGAPLFPIAFWTAEVLLHGGLTREKAMWVESFTATGDASRRFELYQVLTDRLRATHEVGDPPLRDGWVYLLTDAGEAAFKSHNPKAAVPFFEEAWESQGVLRPGHKMTAKAIAHIATGYTSAVVHLKGEDLREELFDVALDRLAESRRLLLSHVPDEELACELLKIGLSCNQVWKNCRKKCKKNKVGWITAAGHCLKHFQEAERDVRAAMGESKTYGQLGSYDYTRLPGRSQSAAARFLLEAAGAAETYGDFRLAGACARTALTISQRPHHKLQASLQLARLELDRTTKVQHYEDLLRDLESGALDKCTPQKRTEIRQQMTDASRELSKTLKRLKRPTAAWFWSQQQARFDPRQSAPTGGHVAPEQPAPSAKSRARQLANAVHREHVPGVVLNLMNLARDYHQDETLLTPEVLDSLAVADSWRPAYRQCGAHLPLSACRSAGDVARVCAEVADEFARGYAPLYRPELLIALASNPSHDVRQRQTAAEQACQASLDVGRATEAIDALLELISLKLGTGSVTQVTAPVRRVRDIVRTTLASAWGTADLIDIAHGLTTTSAKLAGMLAHHDLPGLAFEIAHAPLGALSRAFEQDPDLAKEFELAEQRHSRQRDDTDQRLFEMLHDRVVKHGLTYRPVTFPELADVAACFGRVVSFVQLLHTSPHGTWALGARVTGRQCEYWSCRLDDAENVHDIREAIWDHLSPHEQSCIGRFLTELHAKVVEPWVEKAKGAEALVLIPHGDFSGLPVHAAFGPYGYLIQQHRVGYLPNLNAAPASLVSCPSALIERVPSCFRR